MEIEYHYLRHNTSIFFASPSLILQGTESQKSVYSVFTV